MTTNTRRQDRGVTLLELLVVLMILSIVLTAAVKTWDVTLERGRAQTTASKLTQLVNVIVGDPDYIVSGQRADFGFVGDMGRVPDSLSELVKAPAGSTTWRGPYIHSTFNQSENGYRMDGWGDTIIYGRQQYASRESLFVRSYGGRGVADRSRWQTLNFPYSDISLTQNNVSGHVVDMLGEKPTAGVINRLVVRLYFPADGKPDSMERSAPTSGDFEFPTIPQGTHRLTAYYRTPSGANYTVTQQVPVYPGFGAHEVYLRVPVNWDQQ
jgi:prepilin-type N-terminal cleavage/methylation domain-containing protein